MKGGGDGKRDGRGSGRRYRADLLALLCKGEVSTEIPSTCVSIPS